MCTLSVAVVAAPSSSSCYVTYDTPSFVSVSSGQDDGSYRVVTIDPTYSGDQAHPSVSTSSVLNVHLPQLIVNTEARGRSHDLWLQRLPHRVANLDGNNTIVSTMPSTATFFLNSGRAWYLVQADGYGSCRFDHWADAASESPARLISIVNDTQLSRRSTTAAVV